MTNRSKDSKQRFNYPSFWPNDEILNSAGFFQVSDQTKHTGSTVGMQTSVETSDLLHQRLQGVPKRIERIKKAILRKDFHSFAEITMKVWYSIQTWKSNSFPAIAASMCWELLSSFSMVISQGMLNHLKCLLINEILWNGLAIHFLWLNFHGYPSPSLQFYILNKL